MSGGEDKSEGKAGYFPKRLGKVKKLGLSFLFGVCYNHMNNMVGCCVRMNESYHAPLRAAVMEVII